MSLHKHRNEGPRSLLSTTEGSEDLIFFSLAYAGHLQSPQVSIWLLQSGEEEAGERGWAHAQPQAETPKLLKAPYQQQKPQQIGVCSSRILFFKTQTQDTFVSAIFRAVEYSGVLHSAYSGQLCGDWEYPSHGIWFWKPSKLSPSLLWSCLSLPATANCKTPPPPLTLMLKPCCRARDGASQAQVRLKHGLIMSNRKFTGGEGRANTL